MSAEEVLRREIGRNRAILALQALEDAGYQVTARFRERGFLVSQPRHDLEASHQYGSRLHRLSACVDDRRVVSSLQVSDQLRGAAGVDYDRHVRRELARGFLDELGRALNVPGCVPEETRSEQALVGSEAIVPALWQTAQTLREPVEEQLRRSIAAVRDHRGLSRSI